jgi:hypothetical protein
MCYTLAGWRRTLAIVSLVAILTLAGERRNDVAWAADTKPATVRLVVDYGDGAELHLTAIPWRAEMTVLDALTAVQAHPHGVKFSARGSGRSSLVTKIGDVANEGGGESSRNWMYYVNDKPGDVGAGVRQLKPSDIVLWKFEVYRYNP